MQLCAPTSPAARTSKCRLSIGAKLRLWVTAKATPCRPAISIAGPIAWALRLPLDLNSRQALPPGRAIRHDLRQGFSITPSAASTNSSPGSPAPDLLWRPLIPTLSSFLRADKRSSTGEGVSRQAHDTEDRRTPIFHPLTSIPTGGRSLADPAPKMWMLREGATFRRRLLFIETTKITDHITRS